MPKTADIIIIGGGPGGYETAALAAGRGKHVILFERDSLGGTCLNRGCMPTKCLCASAQRLDEIRSAARLGIVTGDASVDFKAVNERKDAILAELRKGVENSLRDVEIIRAEARFSGPATVTAEGQDYNAEKIIIATGARPASLNIPGADTALDSDGVLALGEVPESMVIIGGGVIGLEFASIFASFGCKVTVIEYCKEILPGFDTEIARRLRAYLSRRGIDFVLGAEVKAIDGNTVACTQKSKDKTIEAACIVMAVGRRPVIPDGLEAAGIETDRRGFIITGEYMQTSAKGIYAIGDVNGRCMLAHAASAQGRKVLGEDVNLNIIPAVVFTEPECASVGLTAEIAGDGFFSVKVPFGAVGKALASDDAEGLLKLTVEKSNGRIAGCQAVGAHSADLIAEAAAAIYGGLTARQLALNLVHAHPTMSELLVAVSGLALKP